MESIFAELGETQKEDVLVRVHFDGNHKYVSDSIVVAHTDQKTEDEATAWLREHIKAGDGLARGASLPDGVAGAGRQQAISDGLKPSSEPFEANSKSGGSRFARPQTVGPGPLPNH